MNKSIIAIAVSLTLSACATTHPKVIALGKISMVDVEGALDFAEGRQPYVMLDHALFCHPASERVIAVPKGYVTDLASIPDIAAWLVDPSGLYATGAIVHDYLFAVGSPGDREGFDTANEIFSDYLKEFEVNFLTRVAINSAVRTPIAFNAYGNQNGWDNRFADLFEGTFTSPPFSKPEDGFFLESYDCDNFYKDYRKLYNSYSDVYDELSAGSIIAITMTSGEVFNGTSKKS